MSTRSRKRILNHFDQNILQTNNSDVVLLERKTRSHVIYDSQKQSRENYVSYPTDDEQSSQVAAKTKKMRGKVVLKELNVDADENYTMQDSIRETRRTKRFVNENHLDEPQLETLKQHVNKKGNRCKEKKQKNKLRNSEDSSAVSNGSDTVVISKKKKGNRKKSKKQHRLRDSKECLKKGQEDACSITSQESFFSVAGSPDKLNNRSNENILTTLPVVPKLTNNDKKTSFDQQKLNDQAPLTPIEHIDTTENNDNNNVAKLNTTIEKSDSKKSRSSSTGGPINITFDKSNSSLSRNSVTSVTSKTSMCNALNASMIVIDSSLDNTDVQDKLANSPQVSMDKVDEQSPPTLIRQGTFTKDGPDPIIMTPKAKSDRESVQTPTKMLSLPAPGSTPYHSNGKRRERSVNLNRTHSLEKPRARRSSCIETGKRMTRVMFCSPVDNTSLATQVKNKVIKSSMKGSNKSFVIKDNDLLGARAGRKRSYTQNDADELHNKRKRLGADELRDSINRLSQPRTSNNMAKSNSTPSKNITPYQSKSESKVARSKLPNFAILHQKEFAKMESLDECQDRKAKRAKRLMSPVGSLAVLERKNNKVTSEVSKLPTITSKNKAIATKSSHTQPILDILNPGYTRFGFKLNTDVNPFSIPAKSVKKPLDKSMDMKARSKFNGFGVQALKKVTNTGLGPTDTSQRKAIAKQVIMREPSSTSLVGRRDMKRHENRTVIKGVRTNRRFELQMQSRYLNI